jgi:hypothetical protein
MIKAGRLEIFDSLSDYLKKPRAQGFAREMFLCSNETLRLGVAPYMIQHFQSLTSLEVCMILTDGTLGNANHCNNLLMKCFSGNKIPVHHVPVTAAHSCVDFKQAR